MNNAKITWTNTDEAPALATKAFLPILKAFTKGTGVDVDLADISLVGRILANFPDNLTEEQKLPDWLTLLGELAKTPEATAIGIYHIDTPPLSMMGLEGNLPVVR